ncbi:DUF4198 domain-containing protein [Hymenobacter glacialis]|uniref:DUF4198 domain-containing protein n=1 Tax=Hymenobacter glacialis TaxID=1908236 RepID=A0A1G1T2E7_9BACT|nr:DUF4198 domain-containing protein [Hymenobacter glacialis]OGX85053.1 hypothetical protein BEN48_15095 [Hymenobacter glacialis]
MKKAFPALVALLGFAGLTAAAREFWLEAPRFFVQPGQTLSIRPLIGENFKGVAWTNRAEKVLRLVRFGPTSGDSTALTPAPGFAPTDTFRTALTFARPGTHVVLLRSSNAFLEMPADQFTAYLRQEGLDYPLKVRQERDEMAKPGRETYRRCAKALVQVGAAASTPEAADTAWRQVYGLPLELVPEQNPYRLLADKSLTVRVLRRGLPAFGAAVQIWQRQPNGLPTTHFTTRANQNGRILLRLSGPGPYLLAAVDMTVAPPNLRERADWQSTWASLTFAGPGAGSRSSTKH